MTRDGLDDHAPQSVTPFRIIQTSPSFRALRRLGDGPRETKLEQTAARTEGILPIYPSPHEIRGSSNSPKQNF